MNVLSLFDGVSCGQVALERAGLEAGSYYASEIEDDAIEVALKNYPSTITIGDINDLTIEKLNKLPKIDMVFAGSPCQGFSRNGNGLNFDDPRSKLFFKFVEILKWVKENNNPNVKFILENVEMKKEWENLISEYVNEEPLKINSTLVSAQKRPRLYWTDIEGVTQPTNRNINLIDILEDGVPPSYDIDENLMRSKPIELGDKVIKRFISVDGGEIVVRNATKQGYLIAEEGDSINLSLPNSQTRRGRVGKGKSNTLDTQCNQAVVADGRIRRFTITELERLQTLPDGYTEGVSEAKRKKAIGNGWTVDVVAHILSFYKQDATK